MINFNIAYQYIAKYKTNVMRYIAPLSCGALLLCFIAIYVSHASVKIVIYDKQKLFNDYLKSIKVLNNHQQNSDDFKQLLYEKNEFFIKAMIADLVKYQQSHNAIIVKRDSLEVPGGILGSRKDITSAIEHELVAQGAIAQGALS